MKPSLFTAQPFDSTLQNSESETIARNIMVILVRTGDTFRELTWEEYKAERLKEPKPNFDDREKFWFEQVRYLALGEKKPLLNFSRTWKDAYIKHLESKTNNPGISGIKDIMDIILDNCAKEYGSTKPGKEGVIYADGVDVILVSKLLRDKLLSDVKWGMRSMYVEMLGKNKDLEVDKFIGKYLDSLQEEQAPAPAPTPATIVEKLLRQGGTSKSGTPRDSAWRLYQTEKNGWAVRDINHFEWRAVLLEIKDKEAAIKFLNDNNIKFEE
jgi:hypothetical protein